MEALIKSIKEEIGKLVAEENTDFNKLNMLVKFLAEIKIAGITSVDQAHGVAGGALGVNPNYAFPQYQVQAVPPRNEITMMTDEIREAIHSFKKKDGVPKSVPTGMYISWYDFLEKLGYPSGHTEIAETKNRLLDMIIKSIEEEINSMNNKNQNQNKSGDTSSGQDSTGTAPASTGATPQIEGGAAQ